MSEEKRRVATKFAGILALISIYGFVEIILNGVTGQSIIKYSSTVWLGFMGIGFLLASRPAKISDEHVKSISDNAFSRIVTLTIGILAIAAAILSVPEFNITHNLLTTIKSLISLISIIFILLETWFF